MTEHDRQIYEDLQRPLASIRISYSVFCVTVLLIFADHLNYPRWIMGVVGALAVLHSVYQYLAPKYDGWLRVSPEILQWLDFIFMGLLVYITGGLKSIFYAAYVLPLLGTAVRLGVRGITTSMVLVAGGTGVMYVAGHNVMLLPPAVDITVAVITFAFISWTVGRLIFEERKLRDELYHSSITDHMTNLYTGNYLRARVEEEIQRCHRDGETFAISFLDLDDFKQVNDRYGHIMGDKVLQEVARKMRRNVRGSDVLARYGGDEFVLLMPGSDKEEAHKVLRRLREVAAAIPYPGVQVDLSAGVAVCPEDGESLDILLARADQRMYEKKSG